MSKLIIEKLGKCKITDCDIYTFKGKSKIKIMHSIDNGKNHISLSYVNKLPSYEEMKEARYQICPNVDYMAQVFPPKEEFINLHEFCLQLWEI